MTSYLNQINYDSFLQSALQQQAQIDSASDLQSSLFAQAQEMYQQNKTQNKDSGIESTFLFAPEATQKIAHLISKGRELYNKVGELKLQGAKVLENIKTLPDEVKAKFSDKLGEIETLMKDGSKEAIEKATKSYNALVNVANNAKESGQQIIQKVSTEATDTLNRTAKSAKSIGTQLKTNLEQTGEQLKAVVPSSTEKVSDLIKNSQVEYQKALAKHYENMQNVVSNEKENVINSVVSEPEHSVSIRNPEPIILEPKPPIMHTPSTKFKVNKQTNVIVEPEVVKVPDLPGSKAFKAKTFTPYGTKPEPVLRKANVNEPTFSDPTKLENFDANGNQLESTSILDVFNSSKEMKIFEEPAIEQMIQKPLLDVFAPLREKFGINKIGVTTKAPSDATLKTYNESKGNLDKLTEQLKNAPASLKEELQLKIMDAKTDFGMSNRLIQLDSIAPAEVVEKGLFARLSESLPSFGKVANVASELGGIAGAGLMTAQEFRGQLHDPLDVSQASAMQAEVFGSIAQKGAQIATQLKSSKSAIQEGAQSALDEGKALTENTLNQGKNILQETKASVEEGLNQGKQVASQALEQTQELAGNAKNALQETLNAGKSAVQKTVQETVNAGKEALEPITESITNVATKGSSILESIGEKGILETLGEATGIASIPIVGEIAGLGLLATGIYEGVKDIFGGGTKAPVAPPTMPISSPAGLVRQAGI